MSEIHTEVRNGYIITVWQSKSLHLWIYRVSKGLWMKAGEVEAYNRTDAVNAVLEEIEQ